MSFSFERRELSRYENYEERKIEYSFGLSDTERFDGLLINSNESGMCIIIESPVDIGQEIIVQDDVYGSLRTGTVKWIEKTGENEYKVGLNF